MPNPLYQQLNQSANNPMAGMIKQFNEFRQSLQGDPRQMVQQLLNSGRMTQAQYNQYSQIAQEFSKYLR